MPHLFQNKYRIPSARLESWNYGSPGLYFVTICTANKEKFFGEINHNEIQLTDVGKVAESEWFNTLELRSDMNLSLGDFQIMPNHIHGIISIGDNEFNKNIVGKETILGNKFAPQSKNLASILRGYKSAVTSFAVKNNIKFGWQARYHDHIIRSQEEYDRISIYIQNNVAKWKDDKFYEE
jgi:putative transposase